MSDADHALRKARDAFARGDWVPARDGLQTEDAAGRLGAADLELLARVLWFLGDVAASLPVAERAFVRFVDDGQDTEAARLCLRSALTSAVRGDLVLAEAWLHRAERLLIGRPRQPAHGYLRYVEAQLAFAIRGDAAAAAAAADDLYDLGDRFADPALVSLAGTLRGMSDIISGQAASGFATLDEAMLPVVAGQVDPLWAGDIYCSMIHICEALGDLARMRAWTDALERWARPISELFVYFGVTRIHQLQLLSAEGEWDRVEAELDASSRRLVGVHGALAGAGFTEVGDVRRLRGDYRGAAEAYQLARDQGVDPQPGEALLRHVRGDSGEALALLQAAIGERSGLPPVRLLLAAVEVAVAIGDVALADGYATRLADIAEFFTAPGLAARAGEARARVLLGQGRPAAARPHLEAAAATYRQQRYRHGIARVHELLGRVAEDLGDDAAATASRATAQAIYQQLGATPDVARLTHAPSAAGGLTPREREVLRCIAGGASNLQVAEELFISTKTVGRHLANIYAKLGVSSRLAAAAWARDHHLG